MISRIIVFSLLAASFRGSGTPIPAKENGRQPNVTRAVADMREIARMLPCKGKSCSWILTPRTTPTGATFDACVSFWDCDNGWVAFVLYDPTDADGVDPPYHRLLSSATMVYLGRSATSEDFGRLFIERKATLQAEWEKIPLDYLPGWPPPGLKEKHK